MKKKYNIIKKYIFYYAKFRIYYVRYNNILNVQSYLKILKVIKC